MPKTDTLDTRFTRAVDPPKNRIIWAGYGEIGSGKTTWALGAPGPTLIQSLNRGLEGVVEAFQDEKEIFFKHYDWHPSPDAELPQTQAEDLRDEFTEDLLWSLPKIRSGFWDLESEVWDLFKYAEFGPSEAGAPKNWDALKARIRRLVNLIKMSDANFGFLQSMRNEWAPGPVNQQTGKKGITQTGRRVRAGMEEIGGLVNIDLFHQRIKTDGVSQFTIDVGKVRGPGSRDVQDQVFSDLSFVDFAQLVFNDSSPEDWQ